MSEKAKFTAGPWVDDGDGWIGAESGESVVEYAGCGSHEAWWKNPADKALVLSAPEMYYYIERHAKIGCKEAADLLEKANGGQY